MPLLCKGVKMEHSFEPFSLLYSDLNLSRTFLYDSSSSYIAFSIFCFAFSHVLLLDASSFSISFFNDARFSLSLCKSSFASAFAFEPASFALPSSSSIFLSNSSSFSFVFFSNSFFSSENFSFVIAVPPDFSFTLVSPSSPCPRTFFTSPG